MKRTIIIDAPVETANNAEPYLVRGFISVFLFLNGVSPPLIAFASCGDHQPDHLTGRYNSESRAALQGRSKAAGWR